MADTTEPGWDAAPEVTEDDLPRVYVCNLDRSVSKNDTHLIIEGCKCLLLAALATKIYVVVSLFCNHTAHAKDLRAFLESMNCPPWDIKLCYPNHHHFVYKSAFLVYTNMEEAIIQQSYFIFYFQMLNHGHEIQ